MYHLRRFRVVNIQYGWGCITGLNNVVLNHIRQLVSLIKSRDGLKYLKGCLYVIESAKLTVYRQVGQFYPPK